MQNGVTNVIESLSFDVSNSWGGSRISKSGVRTNGSPKVDRLGGSGGMLPREIWKFKSSEMRFPAF